MHFLYFNFLIAVPPSVQPLPQDGKFVVRKGSTITLECESKGNPPPKITWTRSVSTPMKIIRGGLNYWGHLGLATKQKWQKLYRHFYKFF